MVQQRIKSHYGAEVVLTTTAPKKRPHICACMSYGNMNGSLCMAKKNIGDRPRHSNSGAPVEEVRWWSWAFIVAGEECRQPSQCWKALSLKNTHQPRAF